MKCWAVIAYFATLKGFKQKGRETARLNCWSVTGSKDFANSPTEALSKGMGQKVQVLALHRA